MLAKLGKNSNRRSYYDTTGIHSLTLPFVFKLYITILPILKISIVNHVIVSTIWD